MPHHVVMWRLSCHVAKMDVPKWMSWQCHLTWCCGRHFCHLDNGHELAWPPHVMTWQSVCHLIKRVDLSMPHQMVM